MNSKIVIQSWLDRYNTSGITMSDLAFDNLPFLIEKEPIYNMKGQKVSKSYYDTDGREAVRIVYSRIIDNYTYNDVVYPNVFLGLKKIVHYLDCESEIAYSKDLQPYYFNLLPVFIGDSSETIIGFSSQKLRKVLKDERFAADDYLQAQNPNLYDLLYNRYTSEYNRYLRTGNKTSLVSAMNAEADEGINAVFSNEVFGYAPMTVKELILMNLQ